MGTSAALLNTSASEFTQRILSYMDRAVGCWPEKAQQGVEWWVGCQRRVKIQNAVKDCQIMGTSAASLNTSASDGDCQHKK